METLTRLKILLKKDLGQSWAKIIADMCNCSPELVRAVFRYDLKDRRKIVETALRVLLENKKEYHALKTKIKQITHNKE